MSCFKLPDSAEHVEYDVSEERRDQAWDILCNANINPGEYRNFLGCQVTAVAVHNFSTPGLTPVEWHRSGSEPGKVWLPIVPVCYYGGDVHYFSDSPTTAVSQYWPTADPYEYIQVQEHNFGIQELGLVRLKDGSGRVCRAVQTRQHWALWKNGNVTYQTDTRDRRYVHKCEVFVLTLEGWWTFPPFAFENKDFVNNAPAPARPSGLSKSEAITIQ